jgi:iron-sulfur cluster assembly accessory protein
MTTSAPGEQIRGRLLTLVDEECRALAPARRRLHDRHRDPRRRHGRSDRSARPRRQAHRHRSREGQEPPHARGRDDLRLRVAVQPGGCSGLIYQLYFDERLLENDATVDYDGVEVVVDKMSVPYLDGAAIDFEDTIQKQGFTIDNPNAQGSCACGDSFH